MSQVYRIRAVAWDKLRLQDCEGTDKGNEEPSGGEGGDAPDGRRGEAGFAGLTTEVNPARSVVHT